MKKILLLSVIFSLFSFSVGNTLIQEKEQYSHNIEEKENNTVSDSRIIIVFNTITTDKVVHLQEVYGLELLSCMTKKMCIFNMLQKKNSKRFKKVLKQQADIDEVIFYRKHHFMQY